MSERTGISSHNFTRGSERPPVLDKGQSIFMHPTEVLSDRGLTTVEKRRILASWASDSCAVANQPSPRQLNNGAIVHVYWPWATPHQAHFQHQAW
jgi:hypothetical protein